MSRRLFFMAGSGRTAFVHAGFSWPAFFFGPLWAVAKCQWVLFALLYITEIPLAEISLLSKQRHDDGLLALSSLHGYLRRMRQPLAPVRLGEAGVCV